MLWTLHVAKTVTTFNLGPSTISLDPGDKKKNIDDNLDFCSLKNVTHHKKNRAPLTPALFFYLIIYCYVSIYYY